MPDTEGYRVPEVCRVVGISYRQLDYWARTGLVTPSVRDAGGSGTQRLYSFQDLVQLRVIKKLIDVGVSLQRVRKAVKFLREHMTSEPTGITLMSDGASVYACESEDEVIDLVKRGQGVFAIALDKVWDDLSGSLGTGKAKATKPARRAKDSARAPRGLTGTGGA
jgi:DNA-binding transcriptional MerR regulator